jgi:hypothetical protein
VEISEEFYAHVDKVAKSTSYRWADLDWEDIRQDMWVWLLENPVQLEQYQKDDYETRDRKLRRVATQVAVAEIHGYEQWSGQYVYGTDEIRGLLRAGVVLKTDAGTLTERMDLSLAMMDLKQSNPSYFNVIVDKYVHELELTDTQQKTLLRGVNKLTLLMNQIHNVREYTYHSGPGARQVLSNSTSVAITGSWE